MKHITLKYLATAIGSHIWQVLCPTLPFSAVCTLMVIADVVTARRLARRLQRLAPEEQERLKFSSVRFAHTLSKLAHIYALLLLASAVEYVIIPEVQLTRFVAAAVCFWQAISMLENEASANDARWARIIGRWLVDKTERHLGISLDELHHFKEEKK